jgi:hypothetical protein
MKKGIFKLSIIGLSLLLVVGVFAASGETDEPPLRGDNKQIVQFV